LSRKSKSFPDQTLGDLLMYSLLLLMFAGVILSIVWMSITIMIEHPKFKPVQEQLPLAYEEIYESYLEKSEGIEDDAELNSVLQEVTEDYASGVSELGFSVQSTLVDREKITVRVTGVFNEQDGSSTIYEAKKTTGNWAFRVKELKKIEGNEIHDLTKAGVS